MDNRAEAVDRLLIFILYQNILSQNQIFVEHLLELDGAAVEDQRSLRDRRAANGRRGGGRRSNGNEGKGAIIFHGEGGGYLFGGQNL